MTISQRTAVIDYGMGNLRSVSQALEHVAPDGHEIVVTSDTAVVDSADRIVFPGQGAMRDCMAELDNHGLRDIISSVIHSRPFLGICMGLQALMEWSEEHADTPGLAVFKGGVRRFADGMSDDSGARLKVPHMGWNNVRQAVEHPLWSGIEDDERFYFVHSYFVAPTDETLVAATTEYGTRFTCALANDKLFAVQFHPEKSQRAGLRLLSNFLRWD